MEDDVLARNPVRFQTSRHERESTLVGPPFALLPRVRLTFDRGTLLFSDLADLPDGLDIGQIPGVLWDERIAAHRAPARLCYPIVSELRRRGVPIADMPRPAMGFAWILPTQVPKAGSRADLQAGAATVSDRAAGPVGLRHPDVSGRVGRWTETSSPGSEALCFCWGYW
jgi:hypothetical protein